MKIEKKGDFMIVLPNGKLDTINAPEFRKKLSTILTKKTKSLYSLLEQSIISFKFRTSSTSFRSKDI